MYKCKHCKYLVENNDSCFNLCQQCGHVQISKDYQVERLRPFEHFQSLSHKFKSLWALVD